METRQRSVERFTKGAVSEDILQEKLYGFELKGAIFFPPMSAHLTHRWCQVRERSCEGSIVWRMTALFLLAGQIKKYASWSNDGQGGGTIPT